MDIGMYGWMKMGASIMGSLLFLWAGTAAGSSTIPPIDRSAQKNVETASFGLG